MNKKRCEEYQKYLDVTNTGQAIFLDTVFEAEYDPFVLNRTRVKADTSKLQDPVKRILTKEAEEKTMVDPTKGEQLEQTNRGMLDVRVRGWLLQLLQWGQRVRRVLTLLCCAVLGWRSGVAHGEDRGNAAWALCHDDERLGWGQAGHTDGEGDEGTDVLRRCWDTVRCTPLS